MSTVRNQRTAATARTVNNLAPVIRVNKVPISSFSSVATMSGPRNMQGAIQDITYVITNASGGTLTYVLGDPKLMVAGAFGVVWTQPTSTPSGSVAGIQGSFESAPVSVNGLNYTVTDANQYTEALTYRSANQSGGFTGQLININAVLRNTQEIATRQTIRFDQPFLMDLFNCFTLVVPTGRTVTMTLLLGGNVN